MSIMWWSDPYILFWIGFIVMCIALQKWQDDDIGG